MIAFFDTETTGLPVSWKRPASDTQNWPRVVQIAWLVYDDHGNKLSERMAIVLPRGYDIPEAAAEVHGITTERALAEGEYIEDLLLEFDDALKPCDRLVAHNIAFDDKVMRCEYHRYDEATEMDRIQKLCTMRSSTNLCAIPAPYGKGAFKWPKLSELHLKLFGEDFEGAHDALADIEATARCYWKLRDLYLIN